MSTQHAADLTRLAEWWRTHLADCAPIAYLPFVRARAATPRLQSGTGRRRRSSALARRLADFARERGVAVNLVLLATTYALLYRYSGEERIVIATLNRREGNLDPHDHTGRLSRGLLVRGSLEGAPSFVDLVERIRDAVLAAEGYGDFPIDLLRASLADASPFRPQVMFAVEPIDAFAVPAATADLLSGVAGEASTPDLLLCATASASGLELTADYCHDAIEPVAIDRMLQHFDGLLAAALERPTQPVGELPYLGEAEVRLLTEAPALVLTIPAVCLHHRFEQQVTRTPAAIAASCDGVALRYDELNRRANRLAHQLRAAGVGADQLVGLHVERSLNLVIGILGILKAGGAYVPLDPAYPSERIAFMLKDGAVQVVVTDEDRRARFVDESVTCITVGDQAAQWSEDNPESVVTPAHLAYVIYTSGSTGQPKGVPITHRNVGRLFDAMRPSFGFGTSDVWTLFHSYAFDVSVWEMWGALAHGGHLVVVPYDISRSPDGLADLLERERVTILTQTPSAFYPLIDVAVQPGRSFALRYVILGGEGLEAARLRPWVERFGMKHPQLVDMYGPTEASIYSTYHFLEAADLERRSGSVIGRPVPDLIASVRDAHWQLVPIGVAGELYVGGAAVANGYLNRPALTAERFVTDPQGDGPCRHLYRTGDRVRWLGDGTLEYLGRSDTQIKLRGHRVELGEVEAVLLQQPDVHAAVAVVREDVVDDPRLVAYVVPVHGATPRPEELRARLRRLLPEVMVPSAIVCLTELPLTISGKLDRKALGPPPPAAAAEITAPATAVEASLHQIWATALRRDPEAFGVTDDFLALGGHSLHAIRIMSQVNRQLGVRISLREMFDASTIHGLAILVERERAKLSVQLTSQ